MVYISCMAWSDSSELDNNETELVKNDTRAK